ncbi:DNA ligase D [Granulicella tundricola]|uniref:DNA ligase (ATP) n=1 Tax=Granulicella tundricola (strain ATCC BAA-1859 / DSM 23138 / MP5ACTX9) TaxID=1198114 RepID=E8X211_GRATM|nr:DNA ligase D [Granulicella tundricola]ADW69172.1 DNA ligase D [Granulicella tundricola MP5ACTX9]
MPAAKKTATKKIAAKKSVAKKSAKKAVKSKASPSDAVDEQLARYRSMRDFDVTAEPSGKAQEITRESLPFCIQKHAASHLHYDFRLGWNGVLKSWACAKGPSYNVKDKRLAVQVEDHPIEYGGFEGIIPAGQYGGGTVMLWDQGTWEPQPGHTDVDAGLRDGNLKFIMHGTKMKGKWALIRMGGHAATEKKPNWLLIKEHDDFERGPDDEAITDSEPKSVITGRTLEEIAKNEDHVWNSKETAKPGQAWYRNDVEADKPVKTAALDLGSLPEEHQPTFLKPQLAQETQTPPSADGWLHELKLDGYRMQARKDGKKVQMLTRSGLDWTDRVKAVAAEVARLPYDAVTLDGEVVVVAENGTTNFADLQASFQEGAKNPLTYFCFDLLHLNGHNPRGLSLLERKKLLAEVLTTADRSTLQFSEHLETSGEEMFHKACELHAEGIVSKKATAPYTEGRNGNWLKSKCLHEQEFVVGGYTLPSKGGSGIGALLLGYYDDKARFIYAGRTGTGFTQKGSVIIRKRLEPIEAASSPFNNPSADARRGAIWTRPSMVVQVRFATWTADDQLRQAAFLGIREDKPASEVRRETAAPTPKSAKSATQPTAASHTTKPRVAAKLIAAPTMEKAPVRLTHPDKVVDNETHLTKQQLADFYWAVSERMLPHIANRPLSLVRCPEGSEKPCFFQKHTNHMLPPGIGSIDVPDKKTGTPEPYITLDTREALAGLAQMGCLEVHPWGSCNDDLERADQLTIDLDPDELLPWEVLTGAALDVRKRLKDLGLESWVKTTGGKGLHVVIPIEPELEWPQIKQWCHGFVNLMERADPKLYLTKMTKSARAGKIYLDYLRNERGATAVAPYSPRARKGAGVAVPLAWSELDEPERPVFRVATFPEWGGRLKKDVWADLPKTKQRISKEAQKAAGL